MCGKPKAYSAGVLLFVLLGAAFCAEHPGNPSVAAPTVTAVTQVTHDGVSKTGLLSDESNLYVSEWPSSQHVLAKFSLDGGNRSLVPATFSNIQALDISPDRSRLLIAPIQNGESEFWSLPVKSGSPQKIGEFTGRDAAWSVDGKQLVFAKGNGVYLTEPRGEARQVFTANGSVFAPRLSADGKRVRFTVSNISAGTTALWEVGSDGSNPHALLSGWSYGSNACCGSWTADGRYYIFQVTQSSPTALTTLWALPDAGNRGQSAPFQLTTGPISFGNAAIGRDNKRIWAIGVQPSGDVVRYNPARKEFVAVLPGVSATDVDFSSDGKWVTYVTFPEGTLWRSRADGSERLQLTSAQERTALPRWSPDGKHIAYVSMRPGMPLKIEVLSRDGGAPQPVLEESHGQIDANWSSDGNRIMFGSFRGEAVNIKVVDLKTHAATTVPGSEGLFSPRWSPDGRYIAALSTDLTKVMLFDYTTQKWSAWITEAAGAVNYPIWSADSKYLYFDDLVTDEETIRSVKVGENRAERVFKLEGIDRYLGPFGLWSGRTPDGSWMFVRDRSTQEVYQLSVVLP